MAKKVAKVFTKQIVLIVLVGVVAVGGVIWAIVANLQPKFNSKITQVPAAEYVSGNGTASVMVDDYLYFVGDSVATSDIKYGDNEYYADGKMPATGIYRVKIENSAPVVTYEYDNTSTNEAGEKIYLQEGDEGYNTNVVGVQDWENIGKKGNGIEAVVPKIAGHDLSAMWVFDKYLIYVSPHNRYDNRGNLLSDYLDFFRVDLDGKNHTLIYTATSNDLTRDHFTVWANAADNINLLVYETSDKTIRKINVKTKAVTTLASDVTAVVLPKATQYRTKDHPNETLAQVYGGVMANVFYTKDREDNLQGNRLFRCGIDDGKETLLAVDGTYEEGTTFTPMAVTPLQNGDAQFVFAAKVGDNTNYPLKLCAVTNANLADYQYTQPAIDDNWGVTNAKADTVKIYANGFCTVDNYLHRYQINGTRMELNENRLVSATVDSVLAVMDSVIYVQSGKTVWIVDANGTNSSVSIQTSTASDTTDTETGDTTTANDSTLTLPIGILYQPYGSTGKPMIFAQDADYIRLLTADGTAHYLKFKQA